MPGDKIEKWLTRKVDKARINSATPRPEITDPAEIEKKITRARSIFSTFLSTRTNQKFRENIGFAMTFENMAIMLELSDIPSGMIKEKTDEVVLALPFMKKTEEGYIVSDPDLLYENFGPGVIKRKIVKLLSDNPDKAYSIQEIVDELSLDDSTVYPTIKKLISENEVLALAEKSVGEKGYKKRFFKIAK